LYVAAAALVLAAAVAHRAFFGPPILPMDDAYITLHNAQVVWAGRDPNYPGTSALAGAT
jgi:hypothetical protein